MAIPRAYRNDSLRKAADSTMAIVFARFVMPLMIFVIGTLMSLVGWFAVNSLTEIKTSFTALQISQASDKKDTWTYIGKISDRVSTIAEDVSGIKARIDNQAHRLDNLENSKEK